MAQSAGGCRAALSQWCVVSERVRDERTGSVGSDRALEGLHAGGAAAEARGSAGVRRAVLHPPAGATQLQPPLSGDPRRGLRPELQRRRRGGGGGGR